MNVITRCHHGNNVAALGVVACLMAGLVGCSSSDGLDRRGVRGEVTYDGEPVEKGTITLFPKAQGVVASGKIEAGQYEIPTHEGPIPGEYRVEMTALKDTGRMLQANEPGMEPIEIPEVISYLPHKYNDQTELTVDIKEDDPVTQADFLLEK